MRIYNNSNYILHVGELSLPPGASEVPEGAWEKVARHPLMETWLDLGQVEVEKGDLADITTVKPASKAMKVIESTFDEEKLQAWAKSEKRSTVVAAIQEQLAYLADKSGKPAKDLLTGDTGNGE